MYWTKTELTAEAEIPSPVLLDEHVCPTDALTRGADGVVVVDDTACIGCGICAARCPVGAVSLRTSDARAVVTPVSVKAVSVDDPSEFDALRTSASRLLRWPDTPADGQYVVTQLSRALGPTSALGAASFRRLVRNTFLLAGNVARIRNDGDNAAWAEVAVADGLYVGIVEVESLGGDPDAFRRVMSDVARVVGGYGVDRDRVIPMVAMTVLPNVRTDYYRVIADARRYLEVDVRTLPLAFFLLASRVPQRSTLDLIAGGYVADEQSPEVLSSLLATFGDVGTPLGSIPIK